MLDKSVLSQLSQLKADIEASKEYALGTVAGTNGRYGFVRIDDGRDAFLSPEKMDRVLAGDEVKVCISENKEGKLEAVLEKVINSPLKRFVGQYRVRGAGHFVVPLEEKSKRWIFVPPKSRKYAKDGEFLIAEMSQHPFKDGKAQARVVFRIGQPDEPYIEQKYVKAKYDLNQRPANDLSSQLAKIEDSFGKESFGERKDLTHLPFVTIDSETTMDMDDAVAVEEVESGNYLLHVAIADPSSFIAPKSSMAKSAQKAAQTVYLIGGSVPMLPKRLSNYCFSLQEQKNRPALVCTITINEDGDINDYQFHRGIIRSRHKLSYNGVAKFLQEQNSGDEDNSHDFPQDIKNEIILLSQVTRLRRTFRDTHQLISIDQPDYDYHINDQGKIESVQCRPRNSAQQLIEEAMVATNCCAGDFLAKHNKGIHVQHTGFREDRLGEVKALLKEEEIQYEDELTSLKSYCTLIKLLQNNKEKAHLLLPLRRLTRGGELCLSSKPHLGLGVEHYATMTSPIRRFADLYNHWCIDAILSNEKLDELSEHALIDINDALERGRQADRELQRWLITQFTEQHIGLKAKGKIRIVTQQGFGVRLNELGIDGFVLFDKKTSKKFDAKRMTLEVAECKYSLEQEVDIIVKGIDLDKKRIAFDLA